MYEIKKINLTSLVRFSAILGGLLCLLPTLFVLVIAIIEIFSSSYFRSSSALFAVIYLLAIPLIGVLVGAFFGVIFGLIYNWLAPVIGGIKIELIFHQEEGEDIKK